MGSELLSAIRQIERERGLDAEILISALESALSFAYKKNFNSNQNVEMSIDRETGEIKVYIVKTCVEEVMDEATEISLEEAKEYDPDLEVDDELKFMEEVEPRKFGRIAAQTAKQVIMQRIREAERDKLYDIYDNKLNDIVGGVIRRMEKDIVYFDLGNTEAVMPKREQVASERYAIGSRIKVFVTEVKKTNRGPKIFVSRTHPDLVKRLFELEVPEIQNGIVEIKAISREPGSRTKIAVYSHDENIDASGACIGHRGIRVSAVVDELRGEKIDIIEWSSNIAEFIRSALSPADVIRVDMFENQEPKARVTVPDNQLSLAIGKEGQNARLAARLTGWKIDIIPESELRRIVEGQLLNDDMTSRVKDDDYNPLDDLFKTNDDDELNEIAEDVVDEETEDVKDEDEE
ncbi:MAG: transcription termination/antitermination protein NusA [Clostridia bacterium]|nr:transcription termination/antitermination protein NusA [Clostridia bacterium]